MTKAGTEHAEREPQHHRTIDRVTQILEEVVYQPGMTFAELSRKVDAPKSSVHGFTQGLLAAGWLYHDQNGFHLGPAIHGLILASGGSPRAGLVGTRDLEALYEEVHASVFLGTRAGDDLVYISEVGADLLFDFGARKNIRRGLLTTAGGKVLLAESQPSDLERYLRRRPREESALVDKFLEEYDDIKKTRIAWNYLWNNKRVALAAAVRDQSGQAVGEVTLVGRAEEFHGREDALSKTLLDYVDRWESS